MANTFSCLHYHFIFSTRNREKWLSDESQERAWAYIAETARKAGALMPVVGGMADHLHMLAEIPPTIAIPGLVQKIKGTSSAWIKKEFPSCGGFAWQDGYAIFAVSKSNVEDVKNYILNQREHHRVKTFEEEYRMFLEKHGVRYDEKYLLG